MRVHRILFALALAPACSGENSSFPDDRTPYQGPDAGSRVTCVPNLDGTIDAYELAPTLDEEASYIISDQAPQPVDLIGAVDADGRRVWDWSELESGAQVAQLTARPLHDQWYVGDFPSAQFALPTDPSGRLHGIYAHQDDGLWLFGVASAESDPPEGRTLLVYEAPIRFFPFPFTVGSRWTEVGEVRDGVLEGLSPWSQDDTYEVEVDAAGELLLPDFTFTQALRVHSKLTVNPKVGTREGYTQRQISFVFECFGEVARATSPLITTPEEDPGKDFSTAIEIRRLGWF